MASTETEELPVTEKLAGKWQRMLDYPETLFDRSIVQNYDTGRIKLPRSKTVSMMTEHKIDKAKGIDRPPQWRRITDPKEAKRLWTIDVYFQYYHHHQIWGSHFYRIHNAEVGANGGVNDEFDMIEDPAQKKKAVRANRALEMRDRVRDDTRVHRKKAAVLEKYLKQTAWKHREDRDTEHIRLKEREMFAQEQMRERARRMALAEESQQTKRKTKDD